MSDEWALKDDDGGCSPIPLLIAPKYLTYMKRNDIEIHIETSNIPSRSRWNLTNPNIHISIMYGTNTSQQ